MRRYRLSGLLALLLLAGCGDLGDAPVMTVGAETVHLRDLRRELAELPSVERPTLESREGRRAFADGVASRRLLAALGEEVAAEDPAVRREADAECRRVLVRRLQTLVGGEPRVSDEQIHEATERMAVRWLIQRYRFPDPGAARAAAEAHRNGRSLTAAAAENEGVLVGDGYVQWSPFPDRLLDLVVTADLGSVIGPVETGAGADLALVLDRAPAETQDPDELRARIVRGLRVRAQAARVEELIERLRTGAGIRWSEETRAWLTAKTRAAILADDAQSGASDWAVPVLDSAEEGRVVAEWAGGARWTAGDYRDALREALPAQRPRVRLNETVAAACEAAVTTRLLYEEALRRGLDEEWWAERALRRARQGAWQIAAMDHLSRRRSPASAEVDSLTSLLLSAQPQLFRREDRARVIWFELPSRDAAERERERILARGASARLQDILDGARAPLAGSYLLTTLTRGSIEIPEIERDVFQGGTGALAGPAELRGQWILAACLKIVPGRELSREEALEEVWERMRQAGSAQASEQWLVSRKQELGFSIDEDALDDLAPGA